MAKKEEKKIETVKEPEVAKVDLTKDDKATEVETVQPPVETKTEEKKEEVAKVEKKSTKKVDALSKFIEDLNGVLDDFVSYDFDCVCLKDKIRALINTVK